MSNVSQLAQLACDYIEQIRFDRNHVRWLEALFHAIGTELNHAPSVLEARVIRTKTLTSWANIWPMTCFNTANSVPMN